MFTLFRFVAAANGVFTVFGFLAAYADAVQRTFFALFVKTAAIHAAFNGLLVALVKQYTAPPHWNYTISMGGLRRHYLANGWDERRWLAPKLFGTKQG